MSRKAPPAKLVHLRASALVVDHQWNSRQESSASPAADKDLQADIEKRGLLQPLVVVKVGEEWILVAGFRRQRACAAIDETRTWPCLERSFEDFELGLEAEASGANLAENLHRRNLKPYEIADHLARIRKTQPGITLAQLSELVGLSQGRARELLKVRERAVPEVWAVFKRYGRRYPGAIQFKDLMSVVGLPRLEQLEAWKKIVAASKPKKRQRRTLEDYLEQVHEIAGSVDFRAGVRFGLLVALNREPWPTMAAEETAP